MPPPPHPPPLPPSSPASSLERDLPPTVKAILRKYAHCTVLAGGAVTGAVGQTIEKGADWDVFLHGLTAQEADVVLDEIVRLDGAGGRGVPNA